MAPAKPRNNKRSSGSSYTSTITTIVFIALCVLGVWMLTSNSVIPPQKTSRTAATSSNDSSQNSRQTTGHKDSAVYEDNPGQLPEDAIKTDNNKPKEGQEKQEQQIKDENRETTKQEPEKENENKNEGESVENPQGLHAKEPFEEDGKQKQEGDQISEESSTMTQVHEENRGDTSSRNEQETSGKQDETMQRNGEDHQDQQKGEGGEEQKQQKQKNNQRRKKEPSEDVIQEGTSHDQVEHDDQMPHETSTNSQFHGETSSETQEKGTQQESKSNTNLKQEEEKFTQSNTDNSYLGGANIGIPKESKESKKSWTTQADQSEDQKERRKSGLQGQDGSIYGYTWHLCNVTAATDYIPCLDNEEAIKKLHSRRHYQHRERHCPEKAPTCLVPLPEGYKKPIEWPHSRDKIWYHNVPHTLLAEVKGHQNWVKVAGEFLTFPGGGTQFIHGALHYIDFIQEVALLCILTQSHDLGLKYITFYYSVSMWT